MTFRLKKVMKIIVGFSLLLVLVHFQRNYFIATVQANSMEPTYHSGEKVLYKMNTDFERKDILILKASDNSLFIKRLLGMPGDTINFEADILSINKIKITESYVQTKKERYNFSATTALDALFSKDYIIPYKGMKIFINEDTIKIYKLLIEEIEGKKITRYKSDFYINGILLKQYIFPEDCFYVLGDNRNNSKDSRSYGAISQKNIRGVVIF